MTDVVFGGCRVRVQQLGDAVLLVALAGRENEERGHQDNGGQGELEHG